MNSYVVSNRTKPFSPNIKYIASNIRTPYISKHSRNLNSTLFRRYLLLWRLSGIVLIMLVPKLCIGYTICVHSPTAFARRNVSFQLSPPAPPQSRGFPGSGARTLDPGKLRTRWRRPGRENRRGTWLTPLRTPKICLSQVVRVSRMWYLRHARVADLGFGRPDVEYAEAIIPLWG